MYARAGPGSGSGFNPESGSNWHPGPGSNQIGIRVRVQIKFGIRARVQKQLWTRIFEPGLEYD